MDRKEAVSIFLKDVIKAYQEDQRAKGIRASGASADSLKPEFTTTGGTISGSHYFAYQKAGRRPGGFPPIEKIIEWLKVKTGFNVSEEKGPGLRSLAFLIARKIARRGTDIFQKKRPGLSIEERILDARKQFAKNLLSSVKDEIIEKANKANNKK